jgi:hypothetical protein
MRALRSAVLRQALRRPALSAQPFVLRPQLFAKRQQNNYGPHKEYFQNPDQSPLPDTSPYDPREPVLTVPVEKKRSWFQSALRSYFWATNFLILGFFAGGVFVAWEYTQPAPEVGSEEEELMQEEIDLIIDNHQLVVELREAGWIEKDLPIRPGPDTFIGKIYGTSQGLHIKVFTNPANHFTFMTVFVGFGLDGWPDVTHGGVTATLFQEAAQQHLRSHHSDLKIAEGDFKASVDYVKRVQPGELYTVMIPPSIVGEIGGESLLGMTPLLLRLASLPVLESRHNPTTQETEHVIHINSAESEIMAKGGLNFRVLTDKSDGDIVSKND